MNTYRQVSAATRESNSQAPDERQQQRRHLVRRWLVRPDRFDIARIDQRWRLLRHTQRPERIPYRARPRPAACRRLAPCQRRWRSSQERRQRAQAARRPRAPGTRAKGQGPTLGSTSAGCAWQANLQPKGCYTREAMGGGLPGQVLKTNWHETAVRI